VRVPGAPGLGVALEERAQRSLKTVAQL